MNKRLWSLALSAALVAGVFSALPASAQEAPPLVIPEVVQIDDPVGDANGLNDQDNAYGTPAEGQGDQAFGPGGTATDIRKVWFSNTSTEVSLNIQLNADPSTLAYDTYFRFSSNAGEGTVATDATRGCLQWIASVNGAAGAYGGPTEGNLTDKCNVGDPVLGPLTVSPGEGDGNGFVITVTFPRSYSPLLADGSSLTAPFGVSRILYANGLPPTPAAGSTAAFVTLDNTKRGTDYTLSAGGPVVTPVPDPDPTVDPEPKPKPKPKKCKKKANGKKVCPKKKPKPKPPVVPPGPPAGSCPAYVPGEQGAEVETTVVTDAATAEKPVEIPLEIGAGFGVGGVFEDAIAHAYHNVQVDSTSGSTGLYVRLEMPYPSDYDLFVRNADGTEAARAAGFNPEPAVYNDNTAGGHTEPDAEMIDGVTTADCGGYTIDAGAATGEGGELTLKFWLGEATYTAGGESAMEMFFRTLGLERGAR